MTLAKKIADKYREKENEFMKYLFKGVSDDEVDNIYKTLSKIEDNLKEIKGDR